MYSRGTVETGIYRFGESHFRVIVTTVKTRTKVTLGDFFTIEDARAARDMFWERKTSSAKAASDAAAAAAPQ